MPEEKHTYDDWKKRQDVNKLTREEYEKIRKRQEQLEKAKNLISSGKKTLGNIIRDVTPIASKIADRLRANYDTAIGQPRFGTSIRDMLGFNPTPLNPATARPLYPGVNPYSAQYQFAVPFVNTGPQYPRELFAITPDVMNAMRAMANPNTRINVVQPGQPQAVQMPLINAVPAQPQQTMQTPTSDSQVVFLYDDKNNRVSEVMNEYPTEQQAALEVAKLRKQGLPAFYAANGIFANNIGAEKLKA